MILDLLVLLVKNGMGITQWQLAVLTILNSITMSIIFLPTTSTRNGRIGIFINHFLNSNNDSGLNRRVHGQIIQTGQIGTILLTGRHGVAKLSWFVRWMSIVHVSKNNNSSKSLHNSINTHQEKTIEEGDVCLSG
jgi:hypothetical protein